MINSISSAIISDIVSRSCKINLKSAFPVPPQSLKERNGIWVKNTSWFELLFKRFPFAHL